MPDEVRLKFYPLAGALIRRHHELLMVRYRAEPEFWTGPCLTVSGRHDPSQDAVTAALLHACADVEPLDADPRGTADPRPGQGTFGIGVWYECIMFGSAINQPHDCVLEVRWVDPTMVHLHPLVAPVIA